MAQKRWPRINGWVPRGGLGFVGLVSSGAAILCSLWADAGLAIAVAVGRLVVSCWCAAGLRRDDAAGEVADRYMARGRGVRLVDMLPGQFETERRFSSDLVFGNLLRLVIGVIRYVCGLRPVG